MKKLIITLLSLTSAAILVCLFLSYTYKYYNPQKQATYLKGQTQNTEVTYIYTNNSEEALKSAEMINEFISKLPQEVQLDFTKNWKVIIAPNASSKILEETDGASNWKLKIIALNTQKNPTITYETFVHEFGHYFDFSYGYCSQSEEFKKIYAQYRETYKELSERTPEEYPTSSPLEFFASVFKEYLLYPDHLSEVAPNAYTYIDNIYKQALTQKTPLEALLQTTKQNLIGFYRFYIQ